MKKQYDLTIICPKHGEVPFTPKGEEGARFLRYCQICENEARNQRLHPSSPYPLQGTSPSVIPELNRGD